MIWLFAVLFAVLCFSIWTNIHELAHVFAAKATVGLKWWRIKWWPHKHPRLGWVFASWTGRFKRRITHHERTIISYAPRIPDIFACVMLLFSALLPWPFILFWLIFWGAGLVDMVTGSLGISPVSDIQVTARHANHGQGCSIWKLRAINWSIILSTLIFTLTTVLLVLL